MKSKIIILISIIFCISIINLVSAVTIPDALAYWNCNNVTGNLTDGLGKVNATSVGSPTTISAIVNNGTYTDGNDFWVVANRSVGNDYNMTGNFSFNFWINSSDNTNKYLIDSGKTNDFYIYLTLDSFRVVLENKYSAFNTFVARDNKNYMITIVKNSTSDLHLFVNGVYNSTNSSTHDEELDLQRMMNSVDGFLFGGDNSWVGTMDELGIWNQDLNISDITYLYNASNGVDLYPDVPLTDISISLLSPTDDIILSVIGRNFTVNYTVNNKIYNLTNTTYYVWNDSGIFNHTVFTEITGTSNLTEEYIDDFILGDYEWNALACYGNVTFSNCSFAISNYSFFVGATVKNQSFNNYTFETQREIFQTNLSLLPGTTFYDARVYYNYTWHDGTIIDLGENNYTISSDFDIPRRNISTNYAWNWRLTYEKSDGSFAYQNLTTRNQTARVINLSFCDSTATYNTNRTLNFSASYETNETNIQTFDFYGTFQYWLGKGTEKKNTTISQTGINNVSICINPNNLTYYSDAIIQYERTSYVKRNYYLVNSSLTNTTNDISLFLLDTTFSTTFIIDVIDSVRVAIADAYIYIQRYYPGTNSFHTVEMAKTDEEGSTTGHFEAETEDYRFIIIKEGVVLYQSGTQKVIKKEIPYTLTFQVEAGASTTWQDIGDLENMVWILTFDNDTSTWTYTYVDTSGTTSYGRLWVYIDNPGSGKTTICNVTSTSSAATLTCDVSGYNQTTYAAIYISRSPEILVWITSHVKSTLKWVFSYEGLFWAIIIIFALGFMGYATGNPSLGIIMTVVGVIGVNILGFASFGLTTIFGMIAIALILLWEMRT